MSTNLQTSVSESGIGFSASNGMQGVIHLRLYFDSLPYYSFQTPIVYDLLNPGFPTSAEYCPTNREVGCFTTFESKGYTGEVEFIKIDTNESIISGTFWFDAINNINENVEIREGRFDIKYKN